MRDVESTFNQSRDAFTTLLMDQTSVKILRRRSVADRIEVSRYDGVVSSVRISEGRIYVGVRGDEFCVYDTDDVLAETVVTAKEPPVRTNYCMCCTRSPLVF